MIDVAAFYLFVEVDNPDVLCERILDFAKSIGVRGTILIAPEGINGTIAGSRESVDEVLGLIRSDPRFSDLRDKRSQHDTLPFRRLKVRVKREIVSLGVGIVDVVHQTGRRVGVDEWNQLLNDPDVIVIDARNDFEVAAGSFPGAINPKTKSFAQFPEFVEANPILADRPRVAMFCTGGIRCEKASAYLNQLGFDEVYQLDGGILRYLEAVPPDQNSWEGECVVFDERRTVNEDLGAGSMEFCHACGQPITQPDRSLSGFERGVSCPRCSDTLTEQQRSGFRERQRQADLAASRGRTHVGPQRG